MKKLFSLFLLAASIAFSQTNSSSDWNMKEAGIGNDNSGKIISLENSIKNTPLNYSSSQIQLNRTSFIGEKKNAGLAILLSFILPGMGELYSGSYSSGKYFTIADAALWGAFIGMNTYHNWLSDRYKSLAASTAGVNNSNKDANFYANVGIYLSEDDYNNAQVLQGNFSGMYNSPSDYWKWPSNTERSNYRDMWSTSEQANNNLRFVVGALIINRIASMINAVRLVAAHNKGTEVGWNLSVGISNQVTLPSQVNINFQTGL